MSIIFSDNHNTKNVHCIAGAKAVVHRDEDVRSKMERCNEKCRVLDRYIPKTLKKILKSFQMK